MRLAIKIFALIAKVRKSLGAAYSKANKDMAVRLVDIGLLKEARSLE